MLRLCLLCLSHLCHHCRVLSHLCHHCRRVHKVTSCKRIYYFFHNTDQWRIGWVIKILRRVMFSQLCKLYQDEIIQGSYKLFTPKFTLFTTKFTIFFPLQTTRAFSPQFFLSSKYKTKFNWLSTYLPLIYNMWYMFSLYFNRHVCFTEQITKP